MEFKRKIRYTLLEWSVKSYRMISLSLIVVVFLLCTLKFFNIWTGAFSIGGMAIFTTFLLYTLKFFNISTGAFSMGGIAIFTTILLLWICYCGWYYTWFRFVVYFCVSFFSYFKKLFWNKWVKFFLLIIIIQLLPWIIASLNTQNIPHFQKNFYMLLKDIFFINPNNTTVTIPSLLVAFVITIIISIIIRLVKARQYFLIAEFTDCTCSDDGKEKKGDIDKAIKGISAVLQYEFGRVIYLLNNFEEHRQKPLGKDFNVVEYVADIRELKNWQTFINDESIVKVGSFLDIRLNWVVKMFSRFLYGPIVSGSLHKEGDHFSLIASMEGGGYKQSWRVCSSDIEEHEDLTESEKITKLAGLMAFRILSEIQYFGSSNWMAVAYYFNALLAYRGGMLSEKDKMTNLLEARRWAEKAIRLDNTFSQCYYNLGNIYYNLSNMKAAENAFRKALALKPQYDRCFYELAYIFFEKKQFAAAAWYCDQATVLNPTEAIYWNLRGVIEYDADNAKRNSTDIIDELFTITPSTINFFKNASALSWKTICCKLCSSKRSKWFKNLKEYSAKCLLNLAKVHRMNPDKKMENSFLFPFDKRLRALYVQALFLKPGDNDTFMERGQYFDQKRDKDEVDKKNDKDKVDKKDDKDEAPNKVDNNVEHKKVKYNKAYKSFCNIFEDNRDIEKIEFWAFYLKATILKFNQDTGKIRMKQNEKEKIQKKQNEKEKIQKKQNDHGAKAPKYEIKNVFNLFWDSIAYLLHEKEAKELNEDTYFHLFGVLDKWNNSNRIDTSKILLETDDRFDIDFLGKFLDTIKISNPQKIPPSELGKILQEKLSISIKKLADEEEFRWAKAQQLLMEVKDLEREEDKNEFVINKLKWAIEILKTDHANEIVTLGLYLKLAKAYMKLEEYEYALLFAIHARWLNPCGKKEQITLREVYVAYKVNAVIKSNSSWKSEYENSFIEPPDSIDLLNEIGNSVIKRIKKENRKEESFEKAEEFFEETSKLLIVRATEDDDENEWDKNLNFSNRRELGVIYFYWGLLYQEKKESELALSYFLRAARCGFKKVAPIRG